MSWTLTIHEVPPSGNVIKRLHWAPYGNLLKRWFWLVRAAQGFSHIPKATGKRKLTITRRGARPLDRDNLYASMKPVVDVLRPPRHDSGVFKSGPKKGQPWSRDRIGHGLIQEDDAANLELVVLQEPLPRGQVPHLELHFENITPP